MLIASLSHRRKQTEKEKALRTELQSKSIYRYDFDRPTFDIFQWNCEHIIRCNYWLEAFTTLRNPSSKSRPVLSNMIAR